MSGRLVVIGAGITGLGVAEAAARSGWPVLLLERGAPGGGTTAATSGLLHGGLRYLPWDGAVSLAMAEEAGRLAREHPALVRRQPFLWPLYRGQRYGAATVGALLRSYDGLAPLRGAPPSARLDAAQALEREPGLQPSGLLGAFAFEEWAVDVPGLVSALRAAAERAGAEVLTGRKVTAFRRAGGRLAAAVCGQDEYEGSVFVNAAGPWSPEVARLAGCALSLRLRRGVHLVLPGAPARSALLFPDGEGRVVGLYPRPGEAWLGPTDEPHEGRADDAAPGPEDGPRLLAAARRVLPGLDGTGGRLTMGLRPLAGGLLPSRDWRVADHAGQGAPNLVSAVGGKLTTFAPMARAVLEAAAPRLGRPLPPLPAPEPLPFPLGLLRTRSRAVSAAVSWALLGSAFAAQAAGRLRGEP